MTSHNKEPIPLTVTDILASIPDCDGPFPDVPFAGIGSLFHDIMAEPARSLTSDSDLWKVQKQALDKLTRPDDPESLSLAAQPLRDFLYDDVLKRTAFARFHRLPAENMLTLWNALDTFLTELVAILAAARTQGKGPEAILLGSEQSLRWTVDLDDISVTVTGRYDLLLYDVRHELPHLIDFKLCGVKKDLANLNQVMLYALMLHSETGIEPGATVLNLYPERSPITVGWEQIRSFTDPLRTLIRGVAAKSFPDRISAPKRVFDPRAPLTDAGPFRQHAEAGSDEAKELLRIVRSKFEEFGLHTSPFTGKGGPVATGPAFQILRVVPGPGVKVTSLKNRADDLQVALGLDTAPRIEQGAGFVGIEVPRHDPVVVPLTEAHKTADNPSPSSFTLGARIDGAICRADFSEPSTCHMLVGGQTGSGKSEFVRQALCSLAMSSKPEDLRMIVVDPKMADYQDLNGSPYLDGPVIIDMEKAVEILEALTQEMDERYEAFTQARARNLDDYNRKASRDRLPRKIVAFDEFADAMADPELKKGLEQSVKRLGQKARAAGIHLIIATQSPRKEVVTGLIKANLPCRVALQVADGTESRIVLDENGAERLLGRGDLLAKYGGKTERLQSPYADKETVKKIMFRV